MQKNPHRTHTAVVLCILGREQGELQYHVDFPLNRSGRLSCMRCTHLELPPSPVAQPSYMKRQSHRVCLSRLVTKTMDAYKQNCKI